MEHVSLQDAFKALQFHLLNDTDYAWCWHCNIAMVAQDAGATHKNANARTASFMKTAFGVDTSKFEEYKAFHKQWENKSE
jgi:hypothetical protein